MTILQDKQARLDYVDEYDFSSLRGPFAEEHPEIADRFDEAFGELRKFHKLVILFDGPLANISRKLVDPAWHTQVLQTPQYVDFGEKAVGRYIHHQSHTPETPMPSEALTNFVREYEGHYGPLTPPWTDGIPPAYIASLRRGVVPPEMLQMKWSGWTGRRVGA